MKIVKEITNINHQNVFYTNRENVIYYETNGDFGVIFDGASNTDADHIKIELLYGSNFENSYIIESSIRVNDNQESSLNLNHHQRYYDDAGNEAGAIKGWKHLMDI